MNGIYKVLQDYAFNSGMGDPEDEWVVWVMSSLLGLVGVEEFRKLSAIDDPEEVFRVGGASAKMLEALMTDDFSEVKLPEWFKKVEFPGRVWAKE
jgi:hypothetical protein